MKKFSRHPILSALVATALIAGTGAASAQSDASGQQPTQSGPTNVPDGDIDSFAAAARDMQEIDATYAEKLAQTKDEAARNEIRTRASADMVAAIRENGLTVDRYEQIYRLAQNDQTVADRIRSRLRQPQ